MLDLKMLPSVIIPSVRGSSFLEPLLSHSLVLVLVPSSFLRGGLASPTPNPPPFSSGLGTSYGGVIRSGRHDLSQQRGGPINVVVLL